MRTTVFSADTIAAIILGLLQLGIGLLSLWQQRRLRQAYRRRPLGPRADVC
jgi:ABC-type Fe3+ transport system permease subunit